MFVMKDEQYFLININAEFILKERQYYRGEDMKPLSYRYYPSTPFPAKTTKTNITNWGKSYTFNSHHRNKQCTKPIICTTYRTNKINRKYMHKSLFNTPLQILTDAALNNQLTGIPFIHNPEFIRKYLAPYPVTPKGRMERPSGRNKDHQKNGDSHKCNEVRNIVI